MSVLVPAPDDVKEIGAEPRHKPTLLSLSLAAYAASTVVENTLPASQLGRVSRLTALFLVVVVVLSKSGLPQWRRFNFASVGLVAIAIVAVWSANWSRVPQATQVRSFTFVVLAIAGVALAAGTRRLGRHAVDSVIGGLQVGGLIASAIIVSSRASGNFAGAGANPYAKLAARSSAGGADPNEIALALVVIIMISVFKRPNRFSALFAIPMVIGVFLTGSRGGLLALGVGVAAGLLGLLAVHKTPSAAVVGRAIFAVLGAGLLAWKTLPPALVARFGTILSELSSGTLTGRTILWHAAEQQIRQTPIQGTGAGTAHFIIYQYTGYDLVVHNIHLSLLLEMGFLGWLPFVAVLGVALATAIRLREDFPWALPVMAAVIVGTFALSWEYNKLLWLVLIVICALEQRRKKFKVSTAVPAEVLPSNLGLRE